jgi:hypothetical protein
LLNGYAIFKDIWFLLLAVVPGALAILYIIAYLVGRRAPLGPFSITFLALSVAHLMAAFAIVMAHQDASPGFLEHLAYWFPVGLYLLLVPTFALIGGRRWSSDLAGVAFFGAIVLVLLMLPTHLWVKFHEFAGRFSGA